MVNEKTVKSLRALLGDSERRYTKARATITAISETLDEAGVGMFYLPDEDGEEHPIPVEDRVKMLVRERDSAQGKSCTT